MKRFLFGISILHFFFISLHLSAQSFEIRVNPNSELLKIYKKGIEAPVVTQNAKKGMRPFLHPVRIPDGKGVLTEIHPSHHLHQTGIYWGLKKVNGRDFFMNHGENYYRFQSLKILVKNGLSVSWQTIYDLINEEGNGILRETQTWSLREEGGIFLLDIEWKAKGLTHVKIEKFFVGGLFMRMPWFEGIQGEAVNSLGEKNSTEAEGHRSIWVDVGMKISGMDNWGHIAILDHPDNEAFPTPWRVDHQLGIGPSRQILGDWNLEENETTTEKYRLIIYTGKLNKDKMTELWKNYVCESQN